MERNDRLIGGVELVSGRKRMRTASASCIGKERMRTVWSTWYLFEERMRTVWSTCCFRSARALKTADRNLKLHDDCIKRRRLGKNFEDPDGQQANYHELELQQRLRCFNQGVGLIGTIRIRIHCLQYRVSGRLLGLKQLPLGLRDYEFGLWLWMNGYGLLLWANGMVTSTRVMAMGGCE
eukprot:g36329.t1